jgi:hypothetical protein
LQILASAYITGISVGILVRSPAYWPYVVCAAISIMSKYVLRVKGRHIWNPSNFGISVMLFLAADTVASLSIQWGNYLLPMLVIWVLGSVIIARLHRFHITGIYVASFLAFAFLRSWITGSPWQSEVAPITGPMYQLFIFFMITDPKTTVRSRRGQCMVVFLVALLEMVLRLRQVVYAPFLRAFHRRPGGHAGRDLAGLTPREFCKGGCRVVSADKVSVIDVAEFTACTANCFDRNLRPAQRWALCLIAGLALLAGCKKAPITDPPPAAASGSPHSAPLPSDSEHATAATRVAASAAAAARPSGPIEFTDITAQAGIRFKHNSGAFGKKYLPETMGSGVCFIDYDNDGWQDILLINSMDWPDIRSGNSYPALYHNNKDGTFTDVTRQAGLAVEMYGLGCAVGDYRQRRIRRHLHHRRRLQSPVSQSAQRQVCRRDR